MALKRRSRELTYRFFAAFFVAFGAAFFAAAFLAAFFAILFSLVGGARPVEPSLAHHYRWIELPGLTQDVDYG